MTKRKRYKRYSPEFKREALKRASEEGTTDVIFDPFRPFESRFAQCLQ